MWFILNRQLFVHPERYPFLNKFKQKYTCLQDVSLAHSNLYIFARSSTIKIKYRSSTGSFSNSCKAAQNTETRQFSKLYRIFFLAKNVFLSLMIFLEILSAGSKADLFSCQFFHELFPFFFCHSFFLAQLILFGFNISF